MSGLESRILELERRLEELLEKKRELEARLSAVEQQVRQLWVRQ